MNYGSRDIRARGYRYRYFFTKTMNIELSKQTIEMAIDANVIQSSGNMNSLEIRSLSAQRLTYQVWEHVVAKIWAIMRNKKLLPKFR